MPSQFQRKKRAPWRVVSNGSVEVVIYRDHAGFRVVWYFADQRERKFFADESEAVSFAKKQASALGKSQPKNEAAVEAEIRYLHQLQERMGGAPVDLAVDFYLAHHKRAKFEPAMLPQLLLDLLEQMKQDQLSPSYVGAVEYYLAPIANHFRGHIHEIESGELSRFIRGYTKSARSRCHMANYAKRLFHWARDERKALHQGETEADLVNMPEPKQAEIEIYTPAEMRLMLEHCIDQEEISLLTLGGFVGLRNSEITGERTSHGPLPIESVLLRGQGEAVKVVQKVQDKSVTRYAPIPDNALTWLEALRGKTGPVVTFDRASRVIPKIIERVNEAGAKMLGWIPMKPKKNGLRRSHISYRTAITRDPARVGDECNTSPAKIRSNYRRPGLEIVAHEWYAISRLTAPEDRSGPRPAIGGATPEARSAGR